MSNLVINANSIYDRVIRIGRQTENLVSSITFNVNMWIEEYGAGECVLNVRRNGDGSAYPVPMTIDDGMTTWTITDTDTAKKGRGEIQLVYRAGDKVKTSPIFTISCGESLVGGEVPEPYEGWLTELNRMTAQVEAAKTSADQSAQTAQTAAQTATAKATEAEQSATTASGFAVNASASATSASTSAQAAAQSAEQAAESVSDAEASAQAASQLAQSAESAKQAAQTASESAQASEQTATEKASQAAESAAQAQASADRANVDILRFLPTDTASGAVASFPDGADNMPLKSLVVGITGGATGMTVTQCGKNLLNPNLMLVRTLNIYTINDDKTITINRNDGSAWDTLPTSHIKAGTYVLSRGQSVGNCDIRLGYENFNRTHIMTSGKTSITITVSEDTDIKIKMDYGAGNTYPITDYIQLEAGSAETDFEPYNGIEIPISWEPTIENGTLDVLNGILTDTDTQTEYQIEAHEVNSLLGFNTFYTDTGDTSVAYRADIQRWVEKKLSTRSTVSLTRSMPVQTEETDTELSE